jgi:hypothetical protein
MGRIVSAVWSVVNVTVPFVLTRMSTNADHEMRPPSFQCLIDCLVKISDCPSAASCHSRPVVVKLLIRPSTPKYTTRDHGAQADYFFRCRPLPRLAQIDKSVLFNQMFIFIYTGEKREKQLICYTVSSIRSCPFYLNEFIESGEMGKLRRAAAVELDLTNLCWVGWKTAVST